MLMIVDPSDGLPPGCANVSEVRLKHQNSVGVTTTPVVMKGMPTRFRVAQEVSRTCHHFRRRLPRTIEGFLDPTNPNTTSTTSVLLPLNTDEQFEAWFRSQMHSPTLPWVRVILRRNVRLGRADTPCEESDVAAEYLEDGIMSLEDWPVDSATYIPKV